MADTYKEADCELDAGPAEGSIAGRPFGVLHVENCLDVSVHYHATPTRWLDAFRYPSAAWRRLRRISHPATDSISCMSLSFLSSRDLLGSACSRSVLANEGEQALRRSRTGASPLQLAFDLWVGETKLPAQHIVQLPRVVAPEPDAREVNHQAGVVHPDPGQEGEVGD